MPIVYRCGNCGFILHVFVRVGQNSYGVPTPSELMSQYGGICPACGHPLHTPSLDDIVIKPDGREELLRVLEEARETMKIRWRRLEPLLQQLRLEVERRRAARTAAETPGAPGSLPLGEALA